MHTHTHTHVYNRIDLQIHTHMHIYAYIMSAHIYTYTYIHTRIQNVFIVHASSQLCHGPPKRGHFFAILAGFCYFMHFLALCL